MVRYESGLSNSEERPDFEREAPGLEESRAVLSESPVPSRGGRSIRAICT